MDSLEADLRRQIEAISAENRSIEEYVAWRNPDRRKNGKTLILFDVDGTLAVPAQLAKPAIVEMLARLRKDYAVGIVGAGDFVKQQRQLGGHDMRV